MTQEKLTITHSNCSSDEYVAEEDNKLDDYKQAIEMGQFDVIRVLGYGFSSVVVLANKKTKPDKKHADEDQEREAIKMINVSKCMPAYANRIHIETGLIVAKNFAHPNLVNIYKVQELGGVLAMHMTFCSGGTLLELMMTPKNRLGIKPRGVARIYLKELTSAVYYLHEVIKVVHRDIKMENILLDRGHPRLSDYSFAQDIGKASYLKTRCGSRPYAAPEILDINNRANLYEAKAVDYWSLGVCLHILLTGTFPFRCADVDDMIELARNYQWEKLPGNKKLNDAERSILMKMLEVDVSKRANFDTVVNSAYIKGEIRN